MNQIISTRLSEYDDGTRETRTHALREIVQEIALYSLSMNGFFNNGVFHGGTELRLAHGLPRFSEDLDFILTARNSSFSWDYFKDALFRTFANYNLNIELRSPNHGSSSIHKLLIIEPDILGSAEGGRTPYLRISLELDTNPPQGANLATAFFDFPIPFEVGIMDLPSSFALKCHALLCRSWTKGRDWFDLIWFCSRNIHPQLDLLISSFHQSGPWEGQNIDITNDWLRKNLLQKIKSLDWSRVTRDVLPFLSSEDRDSLDAWGVPLFTHYIERIRIG